MRVIRTILALSVIGVVGVIGLFGSPTLAFADRDNSHTFLIVSSFGSHGAREYSNGLNQWFVDNVSQALANDSCTAQQELRFDHLDLNPFKSLEGQQGLIAEICHRVASAYGHSKLVTIVSAGTNSTAVNEALRRHVQTIGHPCSPPAGSGLLRISIDLPDYDLNYFDQLHGKPFFPPFGSKDLYALYGRASEYGTSQMSVHGRSNPEFVPHAEGCGNFDYWHCGLHIAYDTSFESLAPYPYRQPEMSEDTRNHLLWWITYLHSRYFSRPDTCRCPPEEGGFIGYYWAHWNGVGYARTWGANGRTTVGLEEYPPASGPWQVMCYHDRPPYTDPPTPQERVDFSRRLRRIYSRIYSQLFRFAEEQGLSVRDALVQLLRRIEEEPIEPVEPPKAACGNGRPDPGEQCNDGTGTCGENQTCILCQCVDIYECGNGIDEPGEECEVPPGKQCPTIPSTCITGAVPLICVNCKCQLPDGIGDECVGEELTPFEGSRAPFVGEF